MNGICLIEAEFGIIEDSWKAANCPAACYLEVEISVKL